MADPLFDEWRTYQKLVDNDYMGHLGFFRRLESEIRRRFDKPVTVLDLGCGDVSPIRKLLQNVDICHYHGVDESETALSRAGECLSSLDLSFELQHGDLQEVLQQLSKPYDVILASFSLHHLQSVDDKQKVLLGCRRNLRHEGVVVIIDVFPSGAQNREQYLDDWAGLARDTFTALDEMEMSTLLDHARACDFPESVSVYREMAAEAGYGTVSCLERDVTGNYRMLILE